MEVQSNIARPTVTIEDEIEDEIEVIGSGQLLWCGSECCGNCVFVDWCDKAPEEVVNKWDKRIQNRICEHLLGGTEQQLDKFLEDYKRLALLFLSTFFQTLYSGLKNVKTNAFDNDLHFSFKNNEFIFVFSL